MKELSVEQRLRKIYTLQLIDSKIDELRSVQGELPLQVEQVSNEIKAVENNLQNLISERENAQEQITKLKGAIVDAKSQIEVYSEQQKNVRNNREYESLSKEIEYQELEIQHAEKLIKDLTYKTENKKEVIVQLEEKIESLNSFLEHKKAELESILADTAKEEELLRAEGDKISKSIDEQLLNAYIKIRSRVRNGLAVVSIERGASEGSYFTIPPQRQIEIAARKKIILDENSGRIFVDPSLAEEERENAKKLFKEIESRV